MSGPGTNTGHGHVWPRPDGVRARCGGPAMCQRCAIDAAITKQVKEPDMPTNQTPEELAEECLKMMNRAFHDARYENLTEALARLKKSHELLFRLRDMAASGAGLSDEAPSSQWPQRARVLAAEMFMALEKAKRVMGRDCAISIPEVDAAIGRYAAEMKASQ
jgi:hypothetical protein